jgi:hypothetical protein
MEKPARTVIARKKLNRLWYKVQIYQSGDTHVEPWNLKRNQPSRRTEIGYTGIWQEEAWELIKER